MINEAIQFAIEAHKGQTRKGSNIPYILHCLEAGTIAASLSEQYGGFNPNVVSASILHDTIEDTEATYDMLKNLFNEEIVELVKIQSEDKSKSWSERKKSTINFLKQNDSIEAEIVTLADKLSNMRAIYKDFMIYGNSMWDKFNAGVDLQYWYYNSIGANMKKVRNSKEYKEYMRLIEETFDK